MPSYAAITYSRHAERQMQKRRVSRQDVELALRIGDGHLEDNETWVCELEHIRVLIVERGEAAHVVTVVRLRRHT